VANRDQGGVRTHVEDEIAALAARVDELIAEIEHLRTAPATGPTAVTDNAPTRVAVLPSIDEAWLQNLADGTERVSFGDQSFALYHRVDAQGRMHHFAFQSRDDDVEPSESRTSTR
jgi:hypothetical protein